MAADAAEVPAQAAQTGEPDDGAQQAAPVDMGLEIELEERPRASLPRPGHPEPCNVMEPEGLAASKHCVFREHQPSSARICTAIAAAVARFSAPSLE